MLDSLLLGYSGTSLTSSFDEFRAAIGISIPEYRDLCLTAYLINSVDSLNAGDNMIAGQSFHVSMNEISPSRLVCAGFRLAQVESFLQSISRDIEAARSVVCEISYPYDFTLFRDRPVIRTGQDRYVLIDSTFLVDKVDRGPFFELVKLADKKNREAIFRLWGPAFEHFVYWLVTQSINPQRDTLYARTRFSVNNENEEICDLAICAGESAVLTECKGCYFRGDALESVDPKRLNEEIEKKLEGSADVRQGATQLARSILRLYSYKSTDDTSNADLKKARVIYPLLVVRVRSRIRSC